MHGVEEKAMFFFSTPGTVNPGVEGNGRGGLLYFGVEMQVFYLHVFIYLYLGWGGKVAGDTKERGKKSLERTRIRKLEFGIRFNVEGPHRVLIDRKSGNQQKKCVKGLAGGEGEALLR